MNNPIEGMYSVNVNGHSIDVLVTNYTPKVPEKIWSIPENCYLEEPEEIEWEVVNESEDPLSYLAVDFIDAFDSVKESITKQLSDIINNNN